MRIDTTAPYAARISGRGTCEFRRVLSKLVRDLRYYSIGSLLFLTACASFIGARKHTLEVEAGERIDGASSPSIVSASGTVAVTLANPGDGVRFISVPASSKLAIRYASLTNGTISVAVNNQPARKVNVHSSGSLTDSFLHAIIDIPIPAKATVTLSLTTTPRLGD